MNRLITACLRQNNLIPLVKFPQSLLNPRERKIIEWVKAYDTKYGVAPKVSRVEREFEEFVPIISKDPLADIYDIELREHENAIIIAFANKVIDEAQNGLDPKDTLTKLSRRLSAAQNGIHRYSSFDRASYYSDNRRSIKLGMPVLDKVTGGIMDGEVMYIVGRLGSHKTTLLEIFTHKWWLAGERVLFISNESVPQNVFAYLDAMVGKFNPLHLRTKRIKKSVIRDVALNVRTISDNKRGDVYIPEERGLSPSDVFLLADKLKATMVLIDGIYLMRSGHKVGSTWERITEISRELKQGALDLSIPVVGIHQASRKAEAGSSFDSSAIAYSDALGQDGDIILATIKDHASLIIEIIKNRWGSVNGVGIEVTIDFDTMTFGLNQIVKAAEKKGATTFK